MGAFILGFLLGCLFGAGALIAFAVMEGRP